MERLRLEERLVAVAPWLPKRARVGLVDRLGRALASDEEVEVLLEGAWHTPSRRPDQDSHAWQLAKHPSDGDEANGILVLTDRRLLFVRSDKSTGRMWSVDRGELRAAHTERGSWFPVLEVVVTDAIWRISVFSGASAADRLVASLRGPSDPAGSRAAAEPVTTHDEARSDRESTRAQSTTGESGAPDTIRENLEERTRELLDHVDRLFSRGRTWARGRPETAGDPLRPGPGRGLENSDAEVIFQEAKQAYRIYVGLGDLLDANAPDRSSVAREAYRNDLFALAALIALSDRGLSEAEMSFLVMLLLPLDPERAAEAEDFFGHPAFPSEWSERLLARWQEVLTGLEGSKIELPGNGFRLIGLAAEHDRARGTLHADRVRTLYDRIAAVFAKADGTIGPEEAERLRRVHQLVHRDGETVQEREDGLRPKPSPAVGAPEESIEEILREIDKLVGMEEIKEQIRTLTNVVWIFGDSGWVGSIPGFLQNDWYRESAGEHPDAWLLLGDNAYTEGEDHEYQDAFFEPFQRAASGTPVWSTRGNHDGTLAGAENDYYDFFDFPTGGEAGGVPSGSEAYYSFDYSNVHFVCLDSEGSSTSPTGPMLTWLRADLAATEKDWIVAFFHHPPYSKGSHNSDSEGQLIVMRERVIPVLEEYGVDFVLSGHSHSYERSYLIDGHYGVSSTFEESMLVDGGDGDPLGDGAYVKPEQRSPHAGTVYAVVGTGSILWPGEWDHPAMFRNLSVYGALYLEFDGLTATARFLQNGGAVRDRFAIEKRDVSGLDTPFLSSPVLVWASPNPARDEHRVQCLLPQPGHMVLSVFDSAGRKVAGLFDGSIGDGRHEFVWSGRSSDGSEMPTGVYFARGSFSPLGATGTPGNVEGDRGAEPFGAGESEIRARIVRIR